jgi:dihydroorotate dehydrogenase electron transfer subunit
MIFSLAGLVRDLPLRCEVSLEERMACGIGACLGCAVDVRKEDGERTYERVCHEGPVFNLRELVMGDSREEKDRGDGKG